MSSQARPIRPRIGNPREWTGAHVRAYRGFTRTIFPSDAHGKHFRSIQRVLPDGHPLRVPQWNELAPDTMVDQRGEWTDGTSVPAGGIPCSLSATADIPDFRPTDD